MASKKGSSVPHEEVQLRLPCFRTYWHERTNNGLLKDSLPCLPPFHRGVPRQADWGLKHGRCGMRTAGKGPWLFVCLEERPCLFRKAYPIDK